MSMIVIFFTIRARKKIKLLLATLTKSYKSYAKTLILLPPFAFASLRYAMTNHRYAIKAH